MAASNTLVNSTLRAGGNATLVNSTHYHYGTQESVGPDPLLTLKEQAALGALHDSAERPDPPKCHENTRQAILDRIDLWAKDRDTNAKPILWLTGAAGAGKSAIAQTLVERWKNEFLVIPNFFFWRTSPKRNIKTHLISTLSFQLTKMSPTCRARIEEVVKDGSIFEQNLKSQLQELVVGPLKARKVKGQLAVIVIDGLDECCMNLPRSGGFPGQDYEDQQREILEAVASACQSSPSLRVFIASRPERQIRTSFGDLPLATLALPISLIDEPNANADINLYLDCKFAEIRSRHPGINPSWPSAHQISELVQKSSGQFIYPSIVVKYIARRRQYPVKSLEEVLALRPRPDPQRDHPLAELDALYTLVLQSVDADSMSTVRTVLGCMCYLNNNVPQVFCGLEPGHYPLYFESFLRLSQGELSTHLTDLHSVLSIPTNEEMIQDNRKYIRFMHATLSEYLQDRNRSGDCFLGVEDTYLACSLLLLEHAKTAELDPNAYRSYILPDVLVQFASKSSLSRELMKGLWEFFRRFVGGYPEDGSVEIGPKTVNAETSRRRLSNLQNHLALLKYLLRCNISEIEPSEPHRQLIERHLKESIFTLDPSDPAARSISRSDGWLEFGLRSLGWRR